MGRGMDGDLWELLHSGDWACAHADDEALERVALTAALSCQGEIARTLRRVAMLAPHDLGQASLLWGNLAQQLRAPDPTALHP